MNTQLQELKTRLLEVNDLNSANALLSWDQSTYMPPGGAAARGRQMATLGAWRTRSLPIRRLASCSTIYIPIRKPALRFRRRQLDRVNAPRI